MYPGLLWSNGLRNGLDMFSLVAGQIPMLMLLPLLLMMMMMLVVVVMMISTFVIIVMTTTMTVMMCSAYVYVYYHLSQWASFLFLLHMLFVFESCFQGFVSSFSLCNHSQFHVLSSVLPSYPVIPAYTKVASKKVSGCCVFFFSALVGKNWNVSQRLIKQISTNKSGGYSEMCACSAPFAFLRLSSLVNDLNLYTVVDSNPSVSWSLHPKLHFFLFKHKMGLEYEYLVIYI